MNSPLICMFKNYKPWQWFAIDLANHFGKDKESFENRIEWFLESQETLEDLAEKAESKQLFNQCLEEIRKSQRGEMSGWIVQLDATTSGAQFMSVLTGCERGASVTSLTSGTRDDFYSFIMRGMKISVLREAIKQAVMTWLYGSQREPERLFGKKGEELRDAFEHSMYRASPGSYDLMGTLLKSWQKDSRQGWKQVDDFQVINTTFVSQEIKVETPELGSFTYNLRQEAVSEFEAANAANLVHSMDSYVVRELIRRCSTPRNRIECWIKELELNLSQEEVEIPNDPESWMGGRGMVSLYHLSVKAIHEFSHGYCRKQLKILQELMEFKEFHVVTIHDSFGSLPSNCNHVRYCYKELLAEIAESDIIEFLLAQLYRFDGVQKESLRYTPFGDRKRLAENIRNNANYAIC